MGGEKAETEAGCSRGWTLWEGRRHACSNQPNAEVAAALEATGTRTQYHQQAASARGGAQDDQRAEVLPRGPTAADIRAVRELPHREEGAEEEHHSVSVVG